MKQKRKMKERKKNLKDSLYFHSPKQWKEKNKAREFVLNFNPKNKTKRSNTGNKNKQSNNWRIGNKKRRNEQTRRKGNKHTGRRKKI